MYYNKNTTKYQWNTRVEVVIVSSADKASIGKALKMMKSSKAEEAINGALNTDAKQNIIFTNGIFNTDDIKLPLNFEVKEGVSRVYQHNDAFHVIDVKAVLPAGNKTLDEAKGNVINDYQTELETKWIDELYERFKVEVDEKALKAVKDIINNQ